ncbi:uncharacterized protein GLRG_10341, partial [Colletotrichum graminicola M1.001]
LLPENLHSPSHHIPSSHPPLVKKGSAIPPPSCLANHCGLMCVHTYCNSRYPSVLRTHTDMSDDSIAQLRPRGTQQPASPT